MNEQRRPLLLIDGYNLIKSVPLYGEPLRRSLAAARANLEAVLAAHARRRHLRIALYYDGDEQVAQPAAQQRQGLEIFFSRRPQRADDLIEEAIARHHGARYVRVVSSDREIQRFAARHKIGFVDAQRFADEVEAAAESGPHPAPEDADIGPPSPHSGPSPAHRSPDVDPDLALDADEVDEWEKLFTTKSPPKGKTKE